jgi:gamma-glutamyltranspeptidase/glutathione hydrolase
VLARNGAVATEHPLATAAGLDVLQRGGNAVDAAIASALAAAVVLPAMCGLGGDLFAIVARPGGNGRSAEVVAFHGSGIAPRGASIGRMRAAGEDGGRLMPRSGPLSAAVPGFVDAIFALHERFGSRPVAALAESAAVYAERGYPLSPLGAWWIAERVDLLGRFPTSAAVFLPNGRPPAVGTLFRQLDLARTIRLVAGDGPGVFYRGEIARRIGEFLTENGGALTADDFADHVTDVGPPLATTYRGYTIFETSLPTQGFLVLETLNMVEADDLAALGVASAETVHRQAEAIKLAFADRLAYAGELAFVDTPVATLTSKAWAAERRRQIDPDRAATDVPAGPLRSGDTTYLCAVDGDGLMVSLICSLSGGFGSGVVAGDTGVLLNNRAGDCFSLDEAHPNVYAPGKKTVHTLNCYLVAAPDGTPVLVGGTPGGDSQPQWNVQVLSAMIDGGLDVQAAIEVPRWVVWPGTYPADVGHPFDLRVEDRLGDETIAALARRGHQIKRLGPWGAGRAHQIIARDPATGVLAAGSDPRGEGIAIGL